MKSKIQKVRFVKITISFTSLIPSHEIPTDEREKSGRTPAQLLAYKKCFLLRLPSERVDFIPKKVDSFPKTVDLYL